MFLNFVRNYCTRVGFIYLFIYRRAFRNADVATYVGRYAPDFCTVYAVSKGRALKIKSASEPVTPISLSNYAFSLDTPTVSPQFRRYVYIPASPSIYSYTVGDINTQ